MKKMKKIMAMLLAMVMVLGMTVTAYAAKDGATINVTGLSTNGIQKVTIYEIYRLDANDNSWEKASWVPQDVTPENLDDPKSLEQMKNAVLGTTSEIPTKESITGQVTFDNVQSGAYLVLVEDTTNQVTYNTMVAKTYKYDGNNLIAPDTANVVAKAETYTTDKVQEDDDAVVEVGDLIKYTITTTVPYNDGTVKEFKVSDRLTGATYYLLGEAVKDVNAENKVEVSGYNDLKIPDEVHGETEFTLDLSSLINEENSNAGKKVIITYTVKVNAVDEVTNSAQSSHDTTPEIVKSYTGQAEIIKYGEENKEGKRPALEGAQFALYRLKNNKREYATIDENGYVTGVWTVKEPNGTGKYDYSDVSTVTTDETGVATVKGLDVGTYYFDEVVAPDGYSINSDPSEVVVTKKESNDANKTVTVSGETEMTDTKLSSLPSTGGIGTTIFTIGGCAIMVAAAGLFFASRRKANK